MSDPATSVTPSYDQLIKLLDNLVDWQTFGAFLPRIERHDIEKIEADTTIKGINHQKAALFSKWLRLHPYASWEDVLSALANSREYALASNVYKNLKEATTSSRTDIQLQGIIDLIISLFYHDHSVASANSQELLNLSVLEDEEIKDTVESLYYGFCELLFAVRSALDQKLMSKKIKIVDLTRWIDCHLPNSMSDINECKNLDTIFEKLKPHFDFLQCKLIVNMSKEFLKDEYFGNGEDKKSLVSKLEEHMARANNFCRLNTVKQLKDRLKTIYSPYLSNLDHIEILPG